MAKRHELEERFLEMRLQGKTYQAISEELGVSRQSLFNWAKDQSVNDLMKFAHLSRLQVIAQKYQLNREANLERHGKLLARCLEELENRELSKVPTEKLVKIVLGIQKQIQGLVPQPEKFQDSVFDLRENNEFIFDVFQG